jgi:hypothetical protein
VDQDCRDQQQQRRGDPKQNPNAVLPSSRGGSRLPVSSSDRQRAQLSD